LRIDDRTGRHCEIDGLVTARVVGDVIAYDCAEDIVRCGKRRCWHAVERSANLLARPSKVDGDGVVLDDNPGSNLDGCSSIYSIIIHIISERISAIRHSTDTVSGEEVGLTDQSFNSIPER